VALCWWLAESIEMTDPAVNFCASEATESFLERMGYFTMEDSDEMRMVKAGLGLYKDERYASESKAYFFPLMGMVEKSFREAMGAAAARRYAIQDHGRCNDIGERRYGFVLETKNVRIYSGERE